MRVLCGVLLPYVLCAFEASATASKSFMQIDTTRNIFYHAGRLVDPNLDVTHQQRPRDERTYILCYK